MGESIYSIVSGGLWGDKPTSRGYREGDPESDRNGPSGYRKRVETTPRERAITEYMSRNSGRCLSNSEIARAVGLKVTQVRNTLFDLTKSDPRIADCPDIDGAVYYLGDDEYLGPFGGL